MLTGLGRASRGADAVRNQLATCSEKLRTVLILIPYPPTHASKISYLREVREQLQEAGLSQVQFAGDGEQAASMHTAKSLTKAALMLEARRLGIKGRSRMSKAQLAEAIGAAAEPGLALAA